MHKHLKGFREALTPSRMDLSLAHKRRRHCPIPTSERFTLSKEATWFLASSSKQHQLDLHDSLTCSPMCGQDFHKLNVKSESEGSPIGRG